MVERHCRARYDICELKKAGLQAVQFNLNTEFPIHTPSVTLRKDGKSKSLVTRSAAEQHQFPHVLEEMSRHQARADMDPMPKLGHIISQCLWPWPQPHRCMETCVKPQDYEIKGMSLFLGSH